MREALDALKMPSLVKTTGSKGLHVYVPIVRGPVQKEVWTFAKALAQELARAPSRRSSPPSTASPSGRAGACSSTTTRTRGAGRWRRSTRCGRGPRRRVSTPVTWEEVEQGVRIEDFTVQERARARREARRSLEAAPRRARPLRSPAIPLTACSFATSTSIFLRDLIAQEPPPSEVARVCSVCRDDRVDRFTPRLSALPSLLRPGDLLVVNNTRVFPARLLGRRVPSGGAVECLLVVGAVLDSESRWPDQTRRALGGAWCIRARN